MYGFSISLKISSDNWFFYLRDGSVLGIWISVKIVATLALTYGWDSWVTTQWHERETEIDFLQRVKSCIETRTSKKKQTSLFSNFWDCKNIKVLLFPFFFQLEKSRSLCKVSQATPVFFHHISSIKHWSNITDTLAQKPVRTQLRPPQIPLGVTRDRSTLISVSSTKLRN